MLSRHQLLFWLILAFAVFGLAAILIAVTPALAPGYSWKSETPATEIFSPVIEESAAPMPSEIVLTFGGDVMLSRVVGQRLTKYQDFSWPFRQVAEIFSQADLAVVNLESPFTYGGDHLVLTGSFSFNADPQAIQGLRLAGLDLVSLANNHLGNQGKQGMKDTFDLLGKNQIAYAGAGLDFDGAHQGKILEAKGVKFGFLAYAYPEDLYLATATAPGIANLDIVQAQEDIAALKKQVDVIVVLMHAGVEYVDRPNAQQQRFARAVIDSGADLVIGHHPHWVQNWEIYDGKLILYSLGNLVFDQMWSQETREGAIAKIYFQGDRWQQAEILPVVIEDYGQPRLADEKESQRILRRMDLAEAIIANTSVMASPQ